MLVMLILPVVVFLFSERAIYHYSSGSTKQFLHEWYLNRRENLKTPEVKIVKEERIEETDKKVVLYYADETLHFAVLKQGLFNNAYKVDFISDISQSIEGRYIRTDSGYYALIVGENPSMRVDEVKADIPSLYDPVKWDISEVEYFIHFERLPGEYTENGILQIKAFDDSGEDITQEYKNY
ncbi:hypothetical protein [Bacillus sp. THAF10]|uniref:hypothetical protein n=1 Tax=Bacillus sp. THAF10 TaxID=2587848 RepID=UPI001C12C823|nr:hypothetical protein [Bacillus sp. THAF10]